MGFELRKNKSIYQGLFNLMHKEHGLILTVSELDEIILESNKISNHKKK